MNALIAQPVFFDPRLEVADALTARWLSEATLRLRREIAWLWFQRSGVQGVADGRLPPAGDALVEALDLTRHAEDKRRFFEQDTTARYLGERIASLRSQPAPNRGAWAAIVHQLALDETAQLAMALALLARSDAASATVIAACHGEAHRQLPTLALLQRLSDEPEAALSLDATHPLFRHGLLALAGDQASSAWWQAYEMPALIARTCLFDDGRLPDDLALPATDAKTLVPAEIETAATSLAYTPTQVSFHPLLGDHGVAFNHLAGSLAQRSGRLLVALQHAELPEPSRLSALAAWCWLHDADLLLPLLQPPTDEHAKPIAWPQVPVRWLVPMHDLRATRLLPQHAVQSAIELPASDQAYRTQRLTALLGERAVGLEHSIIEAASRFRLSNKAMEAIGQAAGRQRGILTAQHLNALCRAQARPDLGHLAQPVRTRFALKEMVLPAAQRDQLNEIVRATRALTTVHYGWGTARAWNESGLSALFCGPPGTGKTMAAEAIAHELALPMYRIDLSQVVNKYIGETEKNLKRVFDGIEECDCVVFFDEADALFGKRTSVKDAHDRFANIEVSYLLERMERLKGIAILATNRRKDLDEAFLRRLRYLVEFPLPGEQERERLWRYVFPSAVDTTALDFGYLAQSFQLAGGHIRSIAFNACLQSAQSQPPRVEMATVLCALKRELDKIGRPVSAESFGRYQSLVKMLFAGEAS